MIPYNVLAERYASQAMRDVWSPERKVILERGLWLAALEAQMQLNPALGITPEAIAAYRRNIETVNLESIARREAITRHDVKARIEEFNALAGNAQLLHQGFTSRDLTDNVELMQMLGALTLLRRKTAAVLFQFAERAEDYRDVIVCGRSHNVPGQATTLGKRMANFCEELLFAYEGLDQLIGRYPLRGIKGPMGTQQDMVDLLGGAAQAHELEQLVMKHLGFNRVLTSVGQVYPRSIDFAAVSAIVQLASAPANFANMVRLMAGPPGFLHEGFGEGQSGSSAMPHKINSRTSERIVSLLKVLKGNLTMVTELLGDQWYEGDVSCSAVRRVALADACYALDGIYECTLTVLREMEVFPDAIAAEVAAYAPFLATTAFLMAAVKKGTGRETAHGLIKKHSLAAMADLRSGKGNTLVERLAEDPAYPLDRDEILPLMELDVGLADNHVTDLRGRVDKLMKAFPDARTYVPGPIR